MTNDVTPTQASNLTQVEQAWFHIERKVQEETTRTWVGKLLRFVRGEYFAGKDDDDEVPLGTELTVAIDTWEIGWEKWVGGHLIDRKMGFVFDGYSRPARDELGDMDQSTWPKDEKTGKPADPWQRVDRIIMYAKKGDEDGLYTFSARSYGGIGALNKLMQKAGKLMREHPNEYPIVSLEADDYRHATFGKVDVPSFRIVGWDDDRWLGAQIREEA
jgi:hypothetical protein